LFLLLVDQGSNSLLELSASISDIFHSFPRSVSLVGPLSTASDIPAASYIASAVSDTGANGVSAVSSLQKLLTWDSHVSAVSTGRPRNFFGSFLWRFFCSFLLTMDTILSASFTDINRVIGSNSSPIVVD